jgi:RES domain
LRLPPTTSLRQDDTHRLIPSRYAEEGVLSALADDDEEMGALYELEGATNGRLLAEAGRVPGIGLHELVFGIPNANVVNAAFCYARPQGGRFNSPLRGAWYAGFGQETSIGEVTYHLGAWLAEVDWEPGDWKEPQKFPYSEFLADFRGEFHDIRRTKAFSDCLNKDDYTASQALAAVLLANGSPGVVYPSVRHSSGVCLSCFRPAMVINVRRANTVEFTYVGPLATAKRVIRHRRR